MHTMPILKADALSFSHFPPPAPLLFDQLSLKLLPGVTLLTGGESSGKTTLLRLLAGSLPTNGTDADLQVGGVHLAKNRTAYLQQIAWLDPHHTALDERTARHTFKDIADQRPGFDGDSLQAHIDGLSLAPHLDKALYMMSTGTRRKVLMAAALASGAAVTLLDQPFMALDQPSIDYLLQVLRQASRQTDRAWVVADYEAPDGVMLAGVIALGR